MIDQMQNECIKCGTTRTSSSHPLVENCSRGGGHDWVVNDGKSKRYKCIDQEPLVPSSSHPLV